MCIVIVEKKVLRESEQKKLWNRAATTNGQANSVWLPPSPQRHWVDHNYRLPFFDSLQNFHEILISVQNLLGFRHVRSSIGDCTSSARLEISDALDARGFRKGKGGMGLPWGRKHRPERTLEFKHLRSSVIQKCT
mmetsp:Transcript_9112/g.40030  ORF Transcript_9112/g.40030 Transcript_9112/m.40030 type:complete len:135 (-) Transcript_9112:1384-1788(-)